MGVLDRLFPRRRRDPKQILADDLVNQTQDLLAALVRARMDRDMTQSDVAEHLGVTRTAVTHFERYDSDPKLSTLIRYALAVDARIDISVSDGRKWAERIEEQERFKELGFENTGAPAAARGAAPRRQPRSRPGAWPSRRGPGSRARAGPRPRRRRAVRPRPGPRTPRRASAPPPGPAARDPGRALRVASSRVPI